MDAVTTYLYAVTKRSIDAQKVPEGIDIPNKNHSRNKYCVKLQKSLYSLKQLGRMWYNRLKEFLLQKGFSNKDDCPCVFIKKSSTGFCIISIYVDDLNIIGTQQDIDETRNHLKAEFEMKDLGKTKFCLGLQLERPPTGTLVHQSAYIQNILQKFNMDKSYPSKTPMLYALLKLIKINSDPKVKMKRYWDQKFHISVPLEL
jgi:hypothetical protein